MSERITIKVQGMSCSHCEDFVTRLIEGQEGVIRASVSAKETTANVIYDPGRITKMSIINLINQTEVYNAK